MALQIKLGGIDRTGNCKLDDLLVTNTIAANADIAELTFSIPPFSTWRPLAGNEVIVANGSTVSTGLEFAGMLIDVTEPGGPVARSLRYICHARDYLHLFNKKLINSFSSDLVGHAAPHTADEIVASIVTQSTEGFSTGSIQVGPTVPAERYDYLPPGDIVRRLADTVSYAWWIGYDKAVNFRPTASLLAPVNPINLDTNTADYGSMDITESVQQLKNDVIVKGWKQRSTLAYSQSYTGDGVTRFHLFGYEPSAIADVTATINSVGLTVGVDGVDASAGTTVGSSSSIYACFDNLGFRQNYQATSTETVVIASNYMIPGITEASDLDAQSTAATREGGDGIHQYAYDSPALTATDGSVSLADAKAQSILQRDAWPRITAKFVSYTGGWRAGQTTVINSTKRFLPTGINKTVYVQQVTKRLVNHPSGGSPTIKYEIQVADSFLPQ